MFRRDFLKRASVPALALVSGCKPESPTTPGDGHLLNLDRERRRIVTMLAPGELSERKPLKAEKFLNFMLGDPVTTLRAGEPLEPARARAASQRAFIQEGSSAAI